MGTEFTKCFTQLQQELIQKAQRKEAYDEIADEIFRLR